MTIVKGSCPTCGDVTLAPSSLTLWLSTVPGRSGYEFRCVGCRSVVRKPACADAVRMLVGVVRVVHIPDEATEAHDGPPVTVDEVLDFALALAARDVLVGVA